MKKAKILFVVVLFMCLTSLSLFAQYDNDPAYDKIVPSVIWAPASGGGTWYTSLQIWTSAPGTQVGIIFFYGGGLWREVILPWTSTGTGDCFKANNILGYLASIDTGFDYFGRSGGLWVIASDPIQVMARTWHSGGYAKTINGLSLADSNFAWTGRDMMIMNVVKSTDFRTVVTLFNLVGTAIVDIEIWQNGSVIGSFSKNLGEFDYQAFDVFAAAGLTGTYENCFVVVTTDGGVVACSGATAHNTTNDPAYHVAMGWW